MDRTVRVRRRRKPPLLAVYHGISGDVDLDKIPPSYYCTRIWIGVVPAEDDGDEVAPGYACVVGELYDGDPMQRNRKRIVMDEGIALDPADFSARERLYYGLRDDVMEHPTLYTLRDAVVALKDLYWAESILVPPNNPRFFTFFQNTDGLASYDARYGDARYARHMPFFVSRRRKCNGVFHVDAEERIHNKELVSSLLISNLLEICAECGIFWGRRPPTAERAIGLVCAEMQLNDITYAIRKMSFSDGYDEYEPSEEQVDAKSHARAAAEDLAWWADAGTERRSSWLS